MKKYQNICILTCTKCIFQAFCHKNLCHSMRHTELFQHKQKAYFCGCKIKFKATETLSQILYNIRYASITFKSTDRHQILIQVLLNVASSFSN